MLESVPLSNLEDEFLQMVSLIMNEQKKIIADYAASKQLLENPNVYWDSDMVQMTIGQISTVGFSDHDDLSVLLCDESVRWDQPSSHLKTQHIIYCIEYPQHNLCFTQLSMIRDGPLLSMTLLMLP